MDKYVFYDGSSFQHTQEPQTETEPTAVSKSNQNCIESSVILLLFLFFLLWLIARRSLIAFGSLTCLFMQPDDQCPKIPYGKHVTDPNKCPPKTNWTHTHTMFIPQSDNQLWISTHVWILLLLTATTMD